MTPTRPRSRLLAALALAAASLGALAGVGSSPAGAGVTPVCDVEDEAVLYVCAGYEAFVGRWATTAEVEYWAPRMPAAKTVFTSTLARSAEARHETVWAYYQHFSESGSPSEADLDYWMPLVTQPKGLRKLEAALLAGRSETGGDYVAVLYEAYLDREPLPAEVTYWNGQVALKGRNLVASDVVQSAEARDARVYFAYVNELGVLPDDAGRAYWSERLRTGLIWVDLRIALRSSPAGYPDANGACASPVPLVGYACAN